MWVQLPLTNASVNYMTEVYVQEQRSFHIVYILSLSHTLHVLSHLNIHAVCNLATRGTLHRPHISNARIEGRSGLVFLPVKMLEVSECLSFLSQMICVHVQEWRCICWNVLPTNFCIWFLGVWFSIVYCRWLCLMRCIETNKCFLVDCSRQAVCFFVAQLSIESRWKLHHWSRAYKNIHDSEADKWKKEHFAAWHNVIGFTLRDHAKL